MLATLSGCSWTRTLQTTAAVDYLTRGESNVHYSKMPADAISGEHDIWIPSTPGKDVEARLWYENGQQRAEVISRRSPNIDAIFAGALDSDGQKLADDARRDAMFERILMNVLDRAETLNATISAERAAARMATPAAPTTPGISDLIRSAIRDEVARIVSDAASASSSSAMTPTNP